MVAEARPPLLLEAARRRGRRVPDDLLLVCVSEDSTTEHTGPAIIMLGLRARGVARARAELLLPVMELRESAPAIRLVPTRPEVRESSRLPPPG
ncbi:substrate-binding domain-containing protein [Streptomyces sp. NPDC015144]|uniref:substrate-binding domain-containing protein n=1 Tax=Streptomyces sp. NPDC015144 TaxID=3364944 RepID=UPI0036FB94D3